MGGYQWFLREKLSLCLDILSEDKRILAKIIRREAIHLLKQEINACCHAVHSSARSFASTIVFCHHLWLRTTTLSSDTCCGVEDILLRASPFLQIQGKIFSHRWREVDCNCDCLISLLAKFLPMPAEPLFIVKRPNSLLLQGNTNHHHSRG